MIFFLFCSSLMSIVVCLKVCNNVLLDLGELFNSLRNHFLFWRFFIPNKVPWTFCDMFMSAIKKLKANLQSWF